MAGKPAGPAARSLRPQSTMSACWRRSPRSRASASSPGARPRRLGRRAAADRRGQTISQPLVVARMCELLGRAATTASSTSAPARATTPRCWRGSARTCGAIERHAALSEQARREPLAAGRRQRDASSSATAPRPAGDAPFDAINVAASATAPSTRPRGPARGRRAPRAPGQRPALRWFERTQRGLERRALERVRFVPLVS